MSEINLKLTAEETNVVMEALGNMPFKMVFSLINKIQVQASEQLSNGEAPKKETKSGPKK